MKEKRISIDFDGVIHKYSEGWKDGTVYDVPTPGVRELMEKWIKRGDIVYIFSTRFNPEVNDIVAQKKMVTEWLTKYGFYHFKHYTNLTALKPLADIYIDDKALKFVSLKDIQDI